WEPTKGVKAGGGRVGRTIFFFRAARGGSARMGGPAWRGARGRWGVGGLGRALRTPREPQSPLVLGLAGARCACQRWRGSGIPAASEVVKKNYEKTCARAALGGWTNAPGAGRDGGSLP